MIRRASSFNTARIDHLYRDPHEPDVQLHLHYGDLTDSSQLARLIRTVEPDGIYNLGAQSHVMVSFEQPEYTGDVSGLGTIRLLEAIRETGMQTRLYQAASSEMFGDTPPPQSEATPFQPRSRTPRPSSIPTGSRGTTVRHTTCSPFRGPSSTMKANDGERHSSRARSVWPSRGSFQGSRTASTWATWTWFATGDTRRTTSRRCTGCSSRLSLATM